MKNIFIFCLIGGVFGISSCVQKVPGCTDPTAYNYNPSANQNNGSCVAKVYGCTDPSAYNFNASANENDGSCVAKVFGCTDPTALNYDYTANTNDGSCLYYGQANFWTASNYGDIYVSVTGAGSGVISVYYYQGTPDCSSSGDAVITLAPGTYYWSAYNAAQTLTWSGSVTVTSDGCQNEQLL